MPSCINCESFDPQSKTCVASCRKGGLRSCVTTLINRLSPHFTNGDVLEIGPGVSRQVRKLVRRRGGRWVGLDPRDTPWVSATHVGSVAAIPLPDTSFDVVVASQTMEHWDAAALKTGLSEIHRVLRRGGLLSVDVPMWMHGSKAFLFADESAIVGMFDRDLWEPLTMERWRKLHYPLASIFQTARRESEKIRNHCLGGVPSMWVLQVITYKRQVADTGQAASGGESTQPV